MKLVLRVPAHPGPSLDARDDGWEGGTSGACGRLHGCEKETTRHPERRARDLGGWGHAAFATKTSCEGCRNAATAPMDVLSVRAVHDCRSSYFEILRTLRMTGGDGRVV